MTTQAEIIREAYEQAQGEWTGLDWNTPHGIFEIDIEGMDAAELRTAANDPSNSNHRYVEIFWRRWHTVGDDERCSDPAGTLEKEMVSAADYIEAVEAASTAAEETGEKAMQAVDAGDLSAALRHAEAACSAENDYGDDPTWSDFREAIEEAMAGEKED